MGKGHRYIPASDADREGMLREIGVTSIDDLFTPIPETLRLTELLPLAPALSEQELWTEMSRRAGAGRLPQPGGQFLGGGAYRHHTPPHGPPFLSPAEVHSSHPPNQAQSKSSSP